MLLDAFSVIYVILPYIHYQKDRKSCTVAWTSHPAAGICNDNSLNRHFLLILCLSSCTFILCYAANLIGGLLMAFMSCVFSAIFCALRSLVKKILKYTYYENRKFDLSMFSDVIALFYMGFEWFY